MLEIVLTCKAKDLSRTPNMTPADVTEKIIYHLKQIRRGCPMPGWTNGGDEEGKIEASADGNTMTLTRRYSENDIEELKRLKWFVQGYEHATNLGGLCEYEWLCKLQ